MGSTLSQNGVQVRCYGALQEADLRAEDILSVTKPEVLFHSDFNDAKRKYHDLAKHWHPDRPNGDSKVFAHISALYDKALNLIEKGLWDGKAIVTLNLKSGVGYEVSYIARKDFELGQCYIGTNHVTYRIGKDHLDLICNVTSAFKAYTFKSDKIRKEVTRYLPMEAKTYTLDSGEVLLAVPKPQEMLRLRDVLNHFSGSLDVRHVAWILNTLFNLTCYLSHTKLVHNDISLDTYFIDPKQHSGALLGGWWYTCPLGSQIKKLPKRTFDLLPWRVRTDKKAVAAIDLELVRAVGREMLPASADAAVSSWLKDVNLKATAVETYRSWGDMLKKVYGPRNFIALKVSSKDIYNT